MTSNEPWAETAGLSSLTYKSILLLDHDSMSILYTYLDLPFALRLVCRQLRDAHPAQTKTRYRDVVSCESLVAWAVHSGAANPANDGLLFVAAAAAGNLHVLQYLHLFTDNMVMTQYLTRAAAANGHLTVLVWLRERECPWDDSVAIEAASRGHTHILEYALANDAPVYGTGFLLQLAARHGHMDCVRWLHYNKGIGLTSRAYNNAAAGGHLALLKWMDLETPTQLATRHTSSCAADAGSIECLEYVLRKHGWSPIDCAISAVEANHLHVLRWMVRFPAGKKAMRFSSFEDGSLIGKAAFAGHVKVMEFLVEHGAVLNKDLVVRAADGGSMEALQWLRARQCPWTPQVFVKAAGWPGSEGIMQWALDNGCPKGTGTRACSEAADHGALDNLQWLRANDFPWSEKVLVNACMHPHLNVLEWACANGCKWSARVTFAAARYNSPEALLWLLKAGCPYDLQAMMSVPVLTTWSHPVVCSELRKLVTRLRELDKLDLGEKRLCLLDATDEHWNCAIAAAAAAQEARARAAQLAAEVGAAPAATAQDGPTRSTSKRVRSPSGSSHESSDEDNAAMGAGPTVAPVP